MSGGLQKMQHGHEVMKPGDSLKSQQDHEVMMPVMKLCHEEMIPGGPQKM